MRNYVRSKDIEEIKMGRRFKHEIMTTAEQVFDDRIKPILEMIDILLYKTTELEE